VGLKSLKSLNLTNVYTNNKKNQYNFVHNLHRRVPVYFHLFHLILFNFADNAQQ
jgi:hypothetical protein